VTVRGAVSIGRRLMDPLAELVKLDPKSIGVGQYQHDVDQNALKRTLEDSFGHVRLRGEISSFRGRHSSGHCYFCLKDENARVEAVIWKTAYNRLKFKPEEGLEVIAGGSLLIAVVLVIRQSAVVPVPDASGYAASSTGYRRRIA